MRAWCPLVAACALLAPCVASGQARGPLETATRFFEASQASHCADVWRLFSAGTKDNIRAVVHRREREREGAPRAGEAEQTHCGKTGKLKRGSIRLVRHQGDEAVVASEWIVEAPRHRYDVFFVPKVVNAEELRLVRERGEWRVELPRMELPRRPGLVEVGPVDVTYQPSGNLGRDRIEATAVLRAARETLVAAVRDSTAWARVLPAVTAVRVLAPAGEHERVQLSFAEADRALTVRVRHGEPRDPNAYETSVLWEIEGADKAPVYLRGSWRLAPYTDGTRVSLALIFDSRQWPVDPATGLFSAERMSEAVLGLGK